MKRVLGFALGLFFGAIAGAALVLLLTPQSGGDLRQRVRERLQAIMEEARQAGNMRRTEIAAQFPITKKSEPAETE